MAKKAKAKKKPGKKKKAAPARKKKKVVKSAKKGAPVELPRFDRKQRPDHGLAMKKPPVKLPKTVNAPAPSVK